MDFVRPDRLTDRRLLWAVALLAVFALVAAACGEDDDSNSEDESLSEGAPAEQATPERTEASSAEDTGGDQAPGLEVGAIDFPAGKALLVNSGAGTVDLAGHWLCNRPHYSELPAIKLGPGESLEVEVVGLAEGGGEVAIYTSNSFENSDDIISYVQWGSGGGRATVAETAEIWTGPPAEVLSEGIALVGEPGSADGWS